MVSPVEWDPRLLPRLPCEVTTDVTTRSDSLSCPRAPLRREPCTELGLQERTALTQLEARGSWGQEVLPGSVSRSPRSSHGSSPPRVHPPGGDTSPPCPSVTVAAWLCLHRLCRNWTRGLVTGLARLCPDQETCGRVLSRLLRRENVKILRIQKMKPRFLAGINAEDKMGLVGGRVREESFMMVLSPQPACDGWAVTLMTSPT